MKRIIILAIGLMILLAGCTAPQGDGHYSAEFPYDPLQYMTFLKKEIQATENQLNAAMSLTVTVIRGEYPADKAAATLKGSKDIVQAVRASVDVMRPSAEYIDTRARMLRLLRSVESEFDDLIAELEKPTPDFERLAEIKNLLHGDSLAISSLVNAYWV
jgi:hypothetical protein